MPAKELNISSAELKIKYIKGVDEKIKGLIDTSGYGYHFRNIMNNVLSLMVDLGIENLSVDFKSEDEKKEYIEWMGGRDFNDLLTPKMSRSSKTKRKRRKSLKKRKR